MIEEFMGIKSKFSISVIIFLVTIFVFSPYVFALTFKDVPDSHWANKAIYNLVRLGLTKGYPDGTFRGTHYISRYEAAIFMSSLASAVEAKLGDLKEAGEIRAELEALREEIEYLKSGGAGFRVSGYYNVKAYLSNALMAGAKDINGVHKANITLNRNIGQNTNLNIELDRYDRLIGSDINLSSFDLSVTAKARGNLGKIPLWITISSGEGQIVDPTSAELVNHPQTGLAVKTSLAGIDLGSSFTADAFQNQSDQANFNSGDWSQFTQDLKDLTDSTPNQAGMAKFFRIWTGYAFPVGGTVVSLKFNFERAYNGNLIFRGTNTTAADNRTWLNLDFSHNRIRLGTKFGIPITKTYGTARQRLLVQGYLEFHNLINYGSKLKLWFDRVGSWRYAILNENFEAVDALNRPLTQGMVDYSGLIEIPFTDKINFSGAGSILCNGIGTYNSFAGSLVFSYKINNHTKWDTEYKFEKFRAAAAANDMDELNTGFTIEF